eukprot:COSAG01_NODE_24906_length_762_cov_0.974359_1_plen_75_part_10
MTRVEHTESGRRGVVVTLRGRLKATVCHANIPARMIDIASISSLVRVSTKALELNGCEGAHVCNDAWGSTSTTTR